jgi:hypothetical protein
MDEKNHSFDGLRVSLSADRLFVRNTMCDCMACRDPFFAPFFGRKQVIHIGVPKRIVPSGLSAPGSWLVCLWVTDSSPILWYNRGPLEGSEGSIRWPPVCTEERVDDARSSYLLSSLWTWGVAIQHREDQPRFRRTQGARVGLRSPRTANAAWHNRQLRLSTELYLPEGHAKGRDR